MNERELNAKTNMRFEDAVHRSNTHIIVSMYFSYTAIGGVIEVARNIISGFSTIAPSSFSVKQINPAYRHKARGSLMRYLCEVLLGLRYCRSRVVLLFPNYFFIPVPFSRAKSVVVVHDIMFKHYPEHVGRNKRLVLDLSYRIVQRWADGVIFISKDSEEDFISTYGPPKRYTTIYNPVVLKGSDADLKRTAGPQGAPYAVANFYFYPHKNLTGLLRLFEKIHQVWPELRLVFTGEKTPEFDALVAQCDACTHIEHLGFLPKEQLMALVRDASCFMSMSKFEGFNMSAAEAALLGKPLVLSDLRVHRELFPDYAYFVPLDQQSVNAQAISDFVQGFVPHTAAIAREVTPEVAAQRYLDFMDDVARA